MSSKKTKTIWKYASAGATSRVHAHNVSRIVGGHLSIRLIAFVRVGRVVAIGGIMVLGRGAIGIELLT